MMEHELFMKRCLDLAVSAIGHTAPNPLVGSVFVHENRIISEGLHTAFGKAHAEVMAVDGVINRDFLSSGTLYINLEPCSHYGKTPPCTKKIIESGIKKVVIANKDPFPEVNGSGISALQSQGIEVITGVLETDGRFLNRRFFTFHEKQRPYIILKWAQSADEFIGKSGESRLFISNRISQALVHEWRSHEQAILIGRNTALLDNPRLTNRLYDGKNPTRIVFDSHLSLPSHLNVFDDSAPTIIINTVKNDACGNIEFIMIDDNNNFLNEFLDKMYQRNIQSLIVEGGTSVLDSFINADLWDEARVFISDKKMGDGIPAPWLDQVPGENYQLENDRLLIYYQSAEYGS